MRTLVSLLGVTVLAMVGLAAVPSARQPDRPADVDPAPAGAQANWWTLSDADFVSQYGNLATGTQVQQSQFAWMAFSRANQQVALPSGPQKFSQWELWPSDPETFSPDTPRFQAERKVRTRPHLQPLQQLRMVAHRIQAMDATPFPQAGQEVTRNALSYDYIRGNGLNTQQGIATYLGQAGQRIDFPQGAVEVKAYWVRGNLPGAYQLGGFSLTALHMMVKIKPTPANPFTDDSPSWFWTTFELRTNRSLADAQKFVTYRDVLPAGEAQALLQQAGLGNTPFANYISDGQQIQYFDPQNANIVLGNTQLEWPFATPANHNPATWTAWSSSCHSCHGQASGLISGGGMNVFSFTAPVGPLTGAALPPNGYQPYDFVWALAGAQ
ncbi:MAG: hypothetical protein U0800_27115 [Isosphaeraceae bacterium]